MLVYDERIKILHALITVRKLFRALTNETCCGARRYPKRLYVSYILSTTKLLRYIKITTFKARECAKSLVCGLSQSACKSVSGA